MDTPADSAVASHHRPAVVVDFDGVIHSYTSPWSTAATIPDPPVAGAFDALTSYLNANLDVVICSTRAATPSGRDAINDWLIQHGFARVADVKITNGKPPAMLYIDDRAFAFLGDFPSVSEILAFKPWNKRPPIEAAPLVDGIRPNPNGVLAVAIHNAMHGDTQLLAQLQADGLLSMRASPGEGVKCPKCGQVAAGQGGEYPCNVCGLPLVHDPEAFKPVPAAEFRDNVYKVSWRAVYGRKPEDDENEEADLKAAELTGNVQRTRGEEGVETVLAADAVDAIDRVRFDKDRTDREAGDYGERESFVVRSVLWVAQIDIV